MLRVHVLCVNKKPGRKGRGGLEREGGAKEERGRTLSTSGLEAEASGS